MGTLRGISLLPYEFASERGSDADFFEYMLGS